MSTITKQAVQAVADLKAGYTLGHADVAILNELARIALASLEAEPAIHRWRRVTSEPYGPYPWHYGDFIGSSKPVDGIEDEYFYSAPPTPVSVPDEDLLHMAASAIEELLSNKDRSGLWVWADIPAKLRRAALLQGAEPVTTAYKLPEGWVAVPVDATRSMIDAARRVEEDGYDAMHKAMIAAAPQQEVKP